MIAKSLPIEFKSMQVVFSGFGLWEEDLPRLHCQSEPISISIFPSIESDLFTDCFSSFVSRALKADLIIFFVNGGYQFIHFIEKHRKNTAMGQLFSSAQTRRVLWSVDTHIMEKIERNLSNNALVHHLYSAHSGFIKDFDASKTSWLPCCFRLKSLGALLRDRPLAKRKGNFANVVFPYNSSTTGDRNYLASKMKFLCDEMNISNLFGHIGSWERMIEYMIDAKVVLNLSMGQELNYRHFETQAFNCIALEEITFEHSKIDSDNGLIIPFNRDLSDFSEKLREAMEIASSTEASEFKGQDHIIQGHTMLHRVASIISREASVAVEVHKGLL
ncbi:MAG: glycosyltransferase [Bacteroidota bacterium]